MGIPFYVAFIIICFIKCLIFARGVKKEKKPTVDESFLRVLNEQRFWRSLIQSRLLGPFFRNVPESKSRQSEIPSTLLQDNYIRTAIPPLVIALQNAAESSNSYLSQTTLYGDAAYDDSASPRVLPFLDDPVCDSFVFTSGLFVCGDAVIHNSFTVTSGVNATELLVDSINERSRSSVYLDRCKINALRRDLEPDANNATSAGSTWCYKDFKVRSARVYVLDRAEIGGSLVAGSVRVEMGGSLLVGLRGLLYSNMRFTGGDSAYVLSPSVSQTSRTHSDYAQRVSLSHPSSETARRERLSRLVQATQQGTVHSVVPLSSPTRTSFETDSSAALGHENDASPRELQFDHSFSKVTPRRIQRNKMLLNGAGLYLTENELRTTTCPLIDLVTGSPFPKQEHDHSQSDNTVLPKSSDVANEHPHPPPLFSFSALSQQPGTVGASNHFQEHAERAALQSSASEANRKDESVQLPPLSKDVSYGDLSSINGHAVFDTGALTWVFGNLKTNRGIRVRGGSTVHLHCGHLVANVTDGSGVAVLEGAMVSIGGLLESVVPRVLLQQGSELYVASSLIATRYIRALSGAVLEVWGEVLTSVLTLSEAAKGVVHDALEIEMLLDVSEGSDLSLQGNLGVGFLQITDGSRMTLRDRSADDEQRKELEANNNRRVAVIEDSLVMDSNGQLNIAGVSLLVYASVYVANRSRLHINDGDLFLESAGSFHIVGSQLIVNGHCVAPYGALLIGLGASVRVAGILRVAGRTAIDAETEPVFNTLSQNSWNRPRHTWNHSAANATNNSTLPSSETTPRVRPALFVEDSELLVDGSIEIVNAWVELTRRSRVTVGGEGLVTLQPNHSFVHVHLGSTLWVRSGTLLSGIALLINEGGHVYTPQVPVISTNIVDVTNASTLRCNSLRTFGDLHVAQRSHVVVTENVIVGGSLFSVATRSTVTCRELRQRQGDVFAANQAQLVANGTVWVYGSVVAQGNAVIRVINGSLTAVQGDVVAENLSEIEVEGPLLLFSAYYAEQKQHQNPPAWTNPTTAANSSFNLQANWNSTEPSAAKNFFVTHSVGVMRRTFDSAIKAQKVIPTRAFVQVYEQRVLSLNKSTHSTETIKQEITSSIAAGTTVKEQESRLRQKERYTQQLDRPTSWEALGYYRKKVTDPRITTPA